MRIRFFFSFYVLVVHMAGEIRAVRGPYCFTLPITLHYIIIQPTPHWGSSVTDYIKYYDYLCYLYFNSLDYLSWQQLRYYFPNCVYHFKSSNSATSGNPTKGSKHRRFTCIFQLVNPSKTIRLLFIYLRPSCSVAAHRIPLDITVSVRSFFLCFVQFIVMREIFQ
jgi:hypothetical protein